MNNTRFLKFSAIFISLVTALMFVLGTAFTSFLYAIPITIKVFLFSRISLNRKSIVFFLVFCLVVFYGILVSVVNYIVSIEEVFRALREYGRGILIVASLIFLIQNSDELFTFMKWYYMTSALVVLLSVALVVSFWSNPYLYNIIEEISLLERVTRFYSGLYHNPNYWGMYLLFLVPGLFWLKLNNSISQAFFTIILISLFVNVAATTSRMTISGFIGCILFFLYTTILTSDGFSLKKILANVVFVAFVTSLITYFIIDFDSIIIYLTDNIPNFGHMVDRTERLLTNIEEEDRFRRITLAIDTQFSNLIWVVGGMGLRSSAMPHNSFVLVLVEFGVLAFILYVIALMYLLFASFLANKMPKPYRYFLVYSGIVIFFTSIANDVIEVRSFFIFLSFWHLITIHVLNRQQLKNDVPKF